MKKYGLLSLFIVLIGISFVSAIADTCTDTDGLNIYNKGKISGYEDEFFGESEDKCVTKPMESYLVLQEGYCNGNSGALLQITCINGCVDGVCVGTAQSTPTCTDSDNGKDFYTKGTITGPKFTGKEEDIINAQTLGDSCSTKGEDVNLLEYWCAGGLIVSESHWCPQGCEAGACLPEPVCYDSDGLDYYNKGYTQKDENPRTYDGCKSPNDGTLYERYCRDDGIPYVKEFYCEFGCEEGVCFAEEQEPVNATCTETDSGKDRFTKGITLIWKDIQTDSCNGENLVEYYCSFDLETQKDFIKKDDVECRFGCEDGACIEKTIIQPNISGEPVEIPNQEEYYCEGCLKDNKCYPIGFRTDEEFCSADNEFKGQLEGENNCINNFECDSNICVDNLCVKEGLFRRFLNWFRRLFG